MYLGYRTNVDGVNSLADFELKTTITHSGSYVTTGSFGPVLTDLVIGQ